MRLNNTEEELVGRVVSRLQLSGAGASAGSGRPSSSNQRRGHSNGPPKNQGSSGGSKPPIGNDGKKKKLAGDECAYCGKTGHWARECRKKKRDEAAHTAHAEEEPREGALMLGITSLDPEPTPIPHLEEDPAPPPVTGDALTVEIDGGGRTRWAFAEEEPAPAALVATAEKPEAVALVAVAAAAAAIPRPSGVPAPEIHLDEHKLFVQLGEKGASGSTHWILDTGATNHMTGQRDAFSELDTSVHGTVRFGDGSVIAIEGRGTILFKCKNGAHQVLAGVYYIPRLTARIISVGQLDEDGYKVLIEKGVLRIWDLARRLLIKVERSPSRLYILDTDIDKPVCLVARCSEVAWKWHARFGHLGFQALRALSKSDMVRGLPPIEQVEQLCDSCLAGKQRRHPFPAASKYRAPNLLELVHADLCGPISPETPGGKRSFLLIVDDKSRYMWLVLVASKDQAGQALIQFQARAEVESGRKLGTLRTDRGGEFTARAFAEHCAEHGVQRHLTAPYTPQQNGVVERRNQTVLGMARSMMKAKKMPGWLWGEAVLTAVFILNRSPTRSVEGKTPFEAWYGLKPPVHFLRTFGCVAHVKVPGGRQPKLDDRSVPTVFIGYEPGSKAYRFYNPDTGRVIISRDAVFDEGRAWDWSSVGEPSGQADTEPFHVEYTTMTPRHDVTAGSQQGSAADTQSATGFDTEPSRGSPATPTHTPSGVGDSAGGGVPVEFVSPPTAPDLDNDHDDDAPLRFRTLDKVLGPVQIPGLAERDFAVDEELLLASGDDEPSTFEEARGDARWRKAMLDEMASIEENKTWVLVDLPHGHRPIGLKWVFKLKRDEQGAVIKHKARIVAKGYIQQPGIDYDEVFAPVARMESVRMLLAVAAQRGWLVHHMDVKSAFLNGDLKEEVYVRQPPGFVAAGHEGKVLRLKKALYGLKQAPRAWNAKLDNTLRELGFTRCSSEHGMYTKGGATSRVVVGVYVDDLIITGARAADVDSFKEQMRRMFKMSDLGLLSFYLGLEVKQAGDAITLGQAAYARKLLEKAGMAGCNPCHTPMEVRLRLSAKSSAPDVDATMYRSLVGSLRYLVHTRPDLTFAMGYVSRFMEKPKQDHYAAVKQILRYIAGTINYGIRYPKLGCSNDKLTGYTLTGYSDSDLGGDVDERRSTGGVIFFLGDMPVSWQSQKQKTVALSSCEAEYMAGAVGACQAVWLVRLLGDITGDKVQPPLLKMDNQSAIALSRNPVLHDRSKHIDTKFHFIRECVEAGKIYVDHVSTKEQLADVLTKSLARARFAELRSKIGVVIIK